MTTIEQPDLALHLADALTGSGAFRRFQTELSRHEDEYTRWQCQANAKKLFEIQDSVWAEIVDTDESAERTEQPPDP